MTNGTASGPVTLNISTTASTAMLAWPKLGGKRGWAGAGGGAVLAFLVLLGVPRRKRNWFSMLGVLVMMVALGTLAGCGGGGSSNSGGTGIAGTTAGAYTFTVTGNRQRREQHHGNRYIHPDCELTQFGRHHSMALPSGRAMLFLESHSPTGIASRESK